MLGFFMVLIKTIETNHKIYHMLSSSKHKRIKIEKRVIKYSWNSLKYAYTMTI